MSQDFWLQVTKTRFKSVSLLIWEGERDKWLSWAKYIAHQYQFKLVGWREFQSVFSNLFWKDLNLKGEGGWKGMSYWLMMLKTIGMTLRHDIWLGPEAKRISPLPLHHTTFLCLLLYLCGLINSYCECYFPVALGEKDVGIFHSSSISQVWGNYYTSYLLLHDKSPQNSGV